MSKGFRSSLFGFKKSDVIEYIESANKQNAERNIDLEEKIKDLELQIKNLNDDILAAKQENERLQNIQGEYIQKYAEVEQLSEDIGKLYISAQSTAKEIVEQARIDKQAINQEIIENVADIEEMNTSFGNLKTDFDACMKLFSNAIERLNSTFLLAKSKLANIEDAE